MGLSTANQE